MKIESKQFTATGVEFKDGSDGSPGRMKMYFSTFEKFDDVRPIPERPTKGAFKDYLPELIKSGFSSVNHKSVTDGDLPVATVDSAGEDDKGAWAEVEYHSTQAAKDAYIVAKERHQRGKTVSISMAYKVHEDAYVDMDDPELKAQGITRGRELKKIEVKEIGFVNIPANRMAGATGFKSGAPEALAMKGIFEDALAEQTNSVWNLWSVFCGVTYNIRRLARSAARLGMGYDYEANINEAVAELSARLVASLMEEVAEEANGPDDDYYDYMSAGGTAETKGLTADLTLSDHVEFVTDANKDVTRRLKARADLLLKEGRAISTTRRASIKEYIDSLNTVTTGLTDLLTETEPPAKEDAANAKDNAGDIEGKLAQLRLEQIRFDQKIDEILNPIRSN